jgi:hypothetical protein
MDSARWPSLPDGWQDTYATLHLWTQVVGKVALALAPPLNHSWGIALQVTAQGLSTRPLPHGDRTFTMEFDFIDHRLHIRVADGQARTLPLVARSVADFYIDVMRTLAEMQLAVRVWPVAVELPLPIRLDTDTAHASYEPAAANALWRIVIAAHRVFTAARAEFIGKASPVHFFWGSFDLASSRFSGRPAPPREGPAFMREAYSHEVISHGFWPGSGPVAEPAFYAYVVPPPAGLESITVQPAAAYYHRELGEFILPYAAVRMAADPDAALRSFVDATYAAFAAMAGWNTQALERTAVSAT